MADDKIIMSAGVARSKIRVAFYKGLLCGLCLGVATLIVLLTIGIVAGVVQ